MPSQASKVALASFAAIAGGYLVYRWLSAGEEEKSSSGSKETGKSSSARSTTATGSSSVAVAKASTLAMPVIDLNAFFNRETDPVAYQEACRAVAETFHKYGVVVLRDPRVVEADNNRFLDTMERYFESSDGVRDARPEHSYQVGVTPELVGQFNVLRDSKCWLTLCSVPCTQSHNTL
jgi:hypothetical protein